MKFLYIIAAILLIIGGLNWGLIGVFDFNLVTFLFGKMPMLERAIYIVVGIAALYMIFAIRKMWTIKY